MSIEKYFPEFQDEIIRFVEICHRLYNKEFVCAYDGNVSLKRGDRILITPTHLCKGDLLKDDLLIVRENGEQLYGARRPSSELKLHLAVYAAQPETQCIIHAHPLYATALYRGGKSVDVSVLTEASDTLGDVPVVPFEAPGSKALADAVGAAMTVGIHACVMEKHGVVVAGCDLEATYYMLESLERLARTETVLATMKL